MFEQKQVSFVYRNKNDYARKNARDCNEKHLEKVLVTHVMDKSVSKFENNWFYMQ